MLIINEQNNNIDKINNKIPSFKNKFPLTGTAKIADLFIKSQENLSSTRFIQDTATNWMPKAVFARSKADFAEMSFLEFLESAIFYFAPPLFGEKLFRNGIFNRLQPKILRDKINKQIPNSIDEITKNKNLSNNIKNRTIATKAGIVLSCALIPAAEYALSFAKNLFTLKKFNKSNFNNIANLDKNNGERENLKQQKLVEQNAKYQLKKFGIISTSGLLAGISLAKTGHKSKILQKVSKIILNPGKEFTSLLRKIGIKSKLANSVNGISFDFQNKNGKLALSKGQLGLTAIIGLFGYSKAAEDRGKLDKKEVWTRVPLVVFYTIFGAELFEKAFYKILEKKNKYNDIIQKDKLGKIVTPLRRELPQLAEKLAKGRGTNKIKELSRLTKEKAFIQAVPYAFSLIFMGLTLSAITRFSTQYRYDKEKINNSLTL